MSDLIPPADLLIEPAQRTPEVPQGGQDTEEQLRWAEMTAHNALAPAGGAEGREG